MGGFGVQSSSIKVVMSKIRSWDSLEWKLKPFFSASFGSMDTKVDGRDPILNGVDFDRNLIGGKNRWCINFDQLYNYRNHCSDLNLHCTFFFIFLQTHIWQKNSNVNIEYILLSSCLLITCIPQTSLLYSLPFMPHA